MDTSSSLEVRSGPPQRWRPGSRMARVRASHSYGIVLLLVLASFVFTAAAPAQAWAASVLLALQCGILAVALWTSGVARADSWPVLGLVATGAAIAVVRAVFGSSTIDGSLWIFAALITVAIVVAIVLGALDQGVINVQTVTGAVTVYLLMGMLFVFVYGGVGALESGPFFVQSAVKSPSLLLYFSFVTLATLGYGDYTAAGTLGHTLAVVEALIGQLYLVTVVALIVSRLGQQRAARRGSADD